MKTLLLALMAEQNGHFSRHYFSPPSVLRQGSKFFSGKLSKIIFVFWCILVLPVVSRLNWVAEPNYCPLSGVSFVSFDSVSVNQTTYGGM